MSFSALFVLAASQTLTLTPPSVVLQGEVNEFRLSGGEKPSNPYDPTVASLDAEITDPKGGRIKVPGYWDVAADRSLVNGKEVVSLKAQEGWKLRWAPKVAGRHTFSVRLVHKGGTALMDTVVAVKASSTGGMIGIHPKNPRYFADEKGKTFFPIGPNICWGGDKGTFNYDQWFADYQKAGVNYGRLWLSPNWSTFGLETKEAGYGRIDPGNAWRLDYVMKLAQQKGIHLMLCFESFNVLQAGQIYSGWNDSVYNKANGGPLNDPSEFWENSTANQGFVNKVRYLVARYGAYRSVFAWEFWNEVDLVNSFNPTKVASWHRRMSSALAELDPYNHLISTSHATTPGIPAIDRLEGIEFVQSHHYSSPDIARTVAETEITKRKSFPTKPHYFGEIGADWAGPREKDDPQGYQIHNPMWASIAAGSSAAASSWWWDNLIAPNNLYPLFTPVAKFMNGVDPAAENFQPKAAVLKPIGKLTGYKDIVLENGPVSWEVSEFNKPRTVTITAKGAAGQLPLAGIQHGPRNHPDKVNPVTFEVTAVRPGKLVVDVLEVSGYGGAGLQVSVNGKVVLDKMFTDPDDNAVTTPLTQFAGAYEVSIPAGRSTVLVKNHGNDWFRVAYRIQGLQTNTTPPVIGWTSVGRNTHLTWLRREEATWFNLFQRKIKVPSAPAVKLSLPLAKGTWRVESWDTWKGVIVAKSTVVAKGGVVDVTLPSFRHDLAVKAVRVK